MGVRPLHRPWQQQTDGILKALVIVIDWGYNKGFYHGRLVKLTGWRDNTAGSNIYMKYLQTREVFQCVFYLQLGVF